MSFRRRFTVLVFATAHNLLKLSGQDGRMRFGFFLAGAAAEAEALANVSPPTMSTRVVLARHILMHGFPVSWPISRPGSDA